MKTITISELAKRLSVHPDTIRKWESLGHLTPLKTLGGHRRYSEAQVEQLIHHMKLKDWTGYSFFSHASDAWMRKDRYLWWKRFNESHRCNPENDHIAKEIYTREGGEIAVNALDSLSDEDWSSIDKIDSALEPVYDWYRRHNEYFVECKFYLNSLTIRHTHKIMDGSNNHIDPVSYWKAHDECFFETLKRLNMPLTTDEELNKIGYKLDGIGKVLCGLNGIGDGRLKDIIKGNGIFPKAREQIEFDKKHGWDGVSDFSTQRLMLNHQSAEKDIPS